MKEARKYKYKGEYYTIKELSKISNISPSAIQNRINSGWSIECAVDTPIRNARIYNYNGEICTVVEFGKKYNINSKLIYKRLRNGMTIKEAIETPVKFTGRELTNYQQFDFTPEEKERLQKMDWDKFEKNFKSKPYLGDITRLTR